MKNAQPHSSVGSVQDLRTQGRWFDPRLSQYSFRELMTVLATGVIPLSQMSIVSKLEKQPVFWKEHCVEYRQKELSEKKDGRSGCPMI